jgi:hypothetical protein
LILLEIAEETPSSNFIIFIFIAIGAIVTGSFLGYFILRKLRKEQRIKTLLTKVINTESNFYNAALLTEDCFIYPDSSGETFGSSPLPRNLAEIAELPCEGLAEASKIIGYTKRITLSQINFVKLYKIFWRLNKAFPLIKQKYPNLESLTFLMELKTLPDEEIFAFISHLLEKISLNELQTQISLIMNEVNDSQAHEPWRPLLYKIDALLDLAESVQDRRLLKDLLPVLIFIKYSPELNLQFR